MVNQTSDWVLSNSLFWKNDLVEIVIRGYVFPVIFGVTLITNTIIFFVLMKNITPVSMMLSAIAVFDWITCIVMVPMVVIRYSLGNVGWVPYKWCLPFKITLFYFPPTFHTASLWTTIFMAAQRYFVVRKPFSSHLVTRRLTLGLIIIAFLVGFFVNSVRLVDSYFEPVVVPSMPNSSVSVTRCIERYYSWISHPPSYFSTFFFVKSVFQNFIPSISLLILNILLVRGMRVGSRLPNENMSLSAFAIQKRLRESRRTTAMLLAIVVTTLCAEIPATFVIAVMIATQFGYPLFSLQGLKIGVAVVDVLGFLSFPINFVIYCSMSSDFRATFCNMFCPCRTATSSNVAVAAKLHVETDSVKTSSTSGQTPKSISQESDLHI